MNSNNDDLEGGPVTDCNHDIIGRVERARERTKCESALDVSP